MKQLAYHKNSQDSEASCGEDDSIKTADPRPHPARSQPVRVLSEFCQSSVRSVRSVRTRTQKHCSGVWRGWGFFG